MIFGVPERLVVLIAAWFFGLVFTVVGVWLFVRQKKYVDAAGNMMEIELPFKVKLKTNYPAAAIFLVPAALFGVSMWSYFEEPPRLPISGKIMFRDRRSPIGVYVGIAPGTYMTATDSDGKYSLSVVKNTSGETFNAVVWVPHSSPPLVHLGRVSFDLSGHGTFDHEFGGTQ